MKIVACASESTLSIQDNLKMMLSLLETYHGADLLIFSEAYLHGFDGLTWDYQQDKKIACTLYAPEINRLKAAAKLHKTAISFGFYEQASGGIYSSNLFVDAQGEIIDCYRRVSKGWKIPTADLHYREGEDFHRFTYNGYAWTVALCGDLWDDWYLERIKRKQMDVLVWPVYVNFSIEEWENQQLQDYAQRTKPLTCPVIMVNAYNECDGAYGGAFLFHQGQIIDRLPFGCSGCLEIALKSARSQ